MRKINCLCGILTVPLLGWLALQCPLGRATPVVLTPMSPCAQALAEFHDWSLEETRGFVVDQQVLSTALHDSAEVLRQGLETIHRPPAKYVKQFNRSRWQSTMALNLGLHIYYRMRAMQAFDGWVHNGRFMTLMESLYVFTTEFWDMKPEQQLFDLEALQISISGLQREVDQSLLRNNPVRKIYDRDRWLRLSAGFRGLASSVASFPSWANALESDAFVHVALHNFHELLVEVEKDSTLNNTLREELLKVLRFIIWEDGFGMIATFDEVHHNVERDSFLAILGRTASGPDFSFGSTGYARRLFTLFNAMSSNITGGILQLLRLISLNRSDIHDLSIGEQSQYKGFLEMIEPDALALTLEKAETTPWPSEEGVEFDLGMFQDSYPGESPQQVKPIYH